MKKFSRLPLCILLCSLLVGPSWAYPVKYAEQYYKLYHTQLYQYPENYEENIWYLERALKSDFVNPLYALARPINDSASWAKYRALFRMHVNLKLIEQYRGLARKFDREQTFFFNAPWKEENLESLEIAEHFYRTALYYWPEAMAWAERASNQPYLHYEGIEDWEDERYRIMNEDLDYGEIIRMDLEHLARVRREFEAMDDSTY